MKISSLLEKSFEEVTAEEELFEHLGNLDAVDKELIKTLVTKQESHQRKGKGWLPDKDLSKMSSSFDREWEQRKRKERSFQAQPGRFGAKDDWTDAFDDGKIRTTNMVLNGVGRGSKLEPHELTFADAATKVLEEKPYAAVIVKIDGRQALIVTHASYAENGSSKTAGYKSTVKYAWTFTRDFMRKFAGQKMPPITGTRTFTSEFQKALKSDVTGDISHGSTTAASRIKELFKVMGQLEWVLAKTQEELAAAKVMPSDAKLPKLDTILITIDTERVEKRAVRVKTRDAIERKPRDPSDSKHEGMYMPAFDAYTKDLKSGLSYRLNALKNSKSKSFENSEDLLKHVIDEGYINKLTYMGTTYNLRDNRISFSDLLLGSKGRGESYVEYESEKAYNWNDPKFRAVRDHLKELRQEFVSKSPEPPETYYGDAEGEEREKKRTEWKDSWAWAAVEKQQNSIYLKHEVAPRKIKIKLVLDGGKIVPFTVEMSFDVV